MKGAGCQTIIFGIESGSKKILSSMRKNMDLDKVKETLFQCKKLGINTWTNFIIGMPEETRGTLQETVRFCKDVEISSPIVFFYPHPYPKTELYHQAKELGKIVDEEKHILKLGPLSRLVVNLTSFSDEGLQRLKLSTQKEIYLDFCKKHKSWYLKYFYRLFKSKLIDLFNIIFKAQRASIRPWE